MKVLIDIDLDKVREASGRLGREPYAVVSDLFADIGIEISEEMTGGYLEITGQGRVGEWDVQN